MPAPTRPRNRSVDRPTWASALVARRHTLGLRQEDITERTRDAITQGTVSDIERGKVTPTKMTYSRFQQYLDALDWSPAEFADATGLEVPQSLRTPPDLPEPQPIGGMVRLQVLQAQGGKLDINGEQVRGSRGPQFVDVPEVLLSGSRPKDTKIIEVFGNSMACEDIRLTIPEGSLVIINTVDEPQSGDIIVCELFTEGRWFRVLKIFDRTGHIVLQSYNDDHQPIVLQGDMELIKVGVYVNHTGPGRLAMRRLNRARGLAK